MATGEKREVVISVRLSPEEERILRRESEKQGLPMSTLARRAIARQYGSTTPIQSLAGSTTTAGMATVETGFGRHELQQSARTATVTITPVGRRQGNKTGR